MHLWLRVLFASQWLLTFFPLTGQVGLSLPVINNTATGLIVSPALKVTNFDSVVSMQFVIRWDPKVLSFQDITAFKLPGLEKDKHFNFTQAQDSGLLRFGWTAPSVTAGVKLSDGTEIFRIDLKVIGVISTGSGLVIGEKYPTVFEIGQIQNKKIVGITLNKAKLKQGFVAVGYAVAAHEASGLEESLSLNVFPNPSRESVKVAFTLDRAAEVRLTVLDARGRMVWETEEHCAAGQHGIVIASTRFREKGLYFLKFNTGGFSLLRVLSRI